MNCAGCSLGFAPDAFKLPYGDDFYHAACWQKKLEAIGTQRPVFHERSALYPPPRHDDDDSDLIFD